MTDIITKKEVTVTASPTIPIEKTEKSQTTAYIVYFILGIIEILLAFRFVLKITGANPATVFVNFVYSLSQIFIVPFFGIFPQTTATGAVTVAIFEPATVVAMAVYAVIAWGIVKIVNILSGNVQE